MRGTRLLFSSRGAVPGPSTYIRFQSARQEGFHLSRSLPRDTHLQAHPYACRSLGINMQITALNASSRELSMPRMDRQVAHLLSESPSFSVQRRGRKPEKTHGRPPPPPPRFVTAATN
uniref:Uncharacterized protein n=1 Tax=Sphaerodactylus townsendi TaxID=933632 RepID=A0ACB8FY24_9SAUR